MDVDKFLLSLHYDEWKKVNCDNIELGIVIAEVLHEKLVLKGELHFQCTEVSLYSKIMLFLKQVAKCKYWVGICLFLKKHLRNYRAI